MDGVGSKISLSFLANDRRTGRHKRLWCDWWRRRVGFYMAGRGGRRWFCHSDWRQCRNRYGGAAGSRRRRRKQFKRGFRRRRWLLQ
jgi:hypothetical protein